MIININTVSHPSKSSALTSFRHLLNSPLNWNMVCFRSVGSVCEEWVVLLSTLPWQSQCSQQIVHGLVMKRDLFIQTQEPGARIEAADLVILGQTLRKTSPYVIQKFNLLWCCSRLRGQDQRVSSAAWLTVVVSLGYRQKVDKSGLLPWYHLKEIPPSPSLILPVWRSSYWIVNY